MKKFLPVLLIACAVSARADEIFLKNGTVHHCTVIKVTDQEVRYHPEGQSIDNIIPRDQVEKIVYARREPVPDRIILHDGYALQCKIRTVTDRYISYIPLRTRVELIVERSLVDRIMYGDGRSLSLKTAP